jgi:hypothetical protein
MQWNFVLPKRLCGSPVTERANIRCERPFATSSPLHLPARWPLYLPPACSQPRGSLPGWGSPFFLLDWPALEHRATKHEAAHAETEAVAEDGRCCGRGHRPPNPAAQGPSWTPGPHPAQPSASLDPGGERRPIPPHLAPLIAQLPPSNTAHCIDCIAFDRSELRAACCVRVRVRVAIIRVRVRVRVVA